jgi:hypothetical protein
MAQKVHKNDDYLRGSNDVAHSREKDDIPSDSEGKTPSVPAYPEGYDNQTGEVYDPYGGKKLGMVRVCISPSAYKTYLTLSRRLP